MMLCSFWIPYSETDFRQYKMNFLAELERNAMRWYGLGGKNLLKPCVLYGFSAAAISLSNRPVGYFEKVFLEEWKEMDWCTFYDLIEKESGDAEMNLEKANRLKKA